MADGISFLDKNTAVALQSAGRIADMLTSMRKLRWQFALDKAKQEYGLRREEDQRRWQEKMVKLGEKYKKEDMEKQASLNRLAAQQQNAFAERMEKKRLAHDLAMQTERMKFQSEEARKAWLRNLQMFDLKTDYDWEKTKAQYEHDIKMLDERYMNEEDLLKERAKYQQKMAYLNSVFSVAATKANLSNAREDWEKRLETTRGYRKEDEKKQQFDNMANQIMQFSNTLSQQGIDTESARQQALRRLNDLVKYGGENNYEKLSEVYSTFFDKVKDQLNERQKLEVLNKLNQVEQANILTTAKQASNILEEVKNYRLYEGNKNLQFSVELGQSQIDKLSREYAKNPTLKNREELLKAMRKAEQIRQSALEAESKLFGGGFNEMGILNQFNPGNE